MTTSRYGYAVTVSREAAEQAPVPIIVSALRSVATALEEHGAGRDVDPFSFRFTIERDPNSPSDGGVIRAEWHATDPPNKR